MIDTHAHLYADEFNSDIQAVLERSESAGVYQILMPNIDRLSIDPMLELEMKHPQRLIPMMGLHPCYVKAGFEADLAVIESWLQKRKFIAIGEIGTDLYWDKSTWEWQKEAFLVQMNWAHQYQLPVAIHCRESMEETITLLENWGKPATGVFHCFTGTTAQARRILDLGFSLGIGGVATFKNSALPDTLKEVGLASLVLETDSPYLAPVPHRGKRNEPAYLDLIARRVAECLGVSLEEVKTQTTARAQRLFNLPNTYGK